MKKILTIFLQIVLILIGISVLAFLIWEPQLEGRNLNATYYQIYLNDPFLAFVYVASIAFFVAIYQAFMALSYIRQNKTYSKEVLKSVRIIKYCALVIIGFVVIGEIFIMLNTSDDRAGGLFMGFMVFIISVATAAIATKFERIIKRVNSVKLKNN